MKRLLLVALFAAGCGGSMPTMPAPVPTPPLPPTLTALIQNIADTLQGMLQPDGTYALAPSGVNNGTGCAGSVAGSTDISNTAGPIKTIAWTLPATAVVRPTERFTYSLCCISREQAFSAGINYFTRFTYTTVACSLQEPLR